MEYRFNEVHALNLLSSEPGYSQHFHTPLDLKVMTSIILLCVASAVTGAILFKVDKIVPAQGVLDTQAELFEIRNTEPGFIEQVQVQEGDQVRSGDLLVQFETELTDLEIERLQQQLASLSRSVWNDYYQIENLLDAPTLSPLQQALSTIPNPIQTLGYQGYLARPFADAKAMNRQARENLSEQLNSALKQKTLLGQQLALQKQELDRIRLLFKEGIESQAALDREQTSLLELETTMESTRNKIQQLTSERQQLNREQEKNEAEYVLERFVRIHDHLDEYKGTQFQLASERRVREDLSIRAPISGQVDALLIQGDKERIPQTTTLLTIRPSYLEQDLEIDIQIPAQYAIWVQPGMTFRASSLGNNPEDHGYIQGEITFIAASSEQTEANKERFYRMTGRITQVTTLRPEARSTLLRPGSTLDVEIRAGERRLINYLFDPFSKYLRTAMSEPS